ncbi:MAG: hypothetical protein NTX33_18985 [Propionibacteriales bacterium]|nr:hypothetical protein [Propionibacteriales bacterium]
MEADRRVTTPTAGMPSPGTASISKKTTYIGGINKVTWRFSIKQRISGTPLAQTFDFTVEVFPMGSRICFAGGKCDTTKRWH